VLQCRTSGGKLFHISGAEYVNARLLKFVCVVGTVSKGRAEEQVVLTAARGIRCLYAVHACYKCQTCYFKNNPLSNWQPIGVDGV